MNEEQMRAVLEAEVRRFSSLREAAAKFGVSPSYLCDCLNGRRAPGPSVIEPLGYTRTVTVTYQKRD